MQVNVLSRNPIVFAGKAAGMEKFFKLQHWRVNVDGREDDRVIWERGQFVVIVATTPDHQIVTISEYKMAVEKLLDCLPAGGLKKGETPEEAGRRELEEETGYTGGDCRVFGPLFESADKSTAKQWLVFIQGVSQSRVPQPDQEENILSTQLLTMSEALERTKIVLHRMALYQVRDLLPGKS